MKTLNICAALLFSIFAINFSVAQTTVKKETIKVWGNCGMCKTTIEKAARKAGAADANWNEETKELKVSYAVNKTSSNKIQQAIARSGYDTQDFNGDNKAYDKLHGCCKYERKSSVGLTAAGCCKDEKCVKDAGDCKTIQCCKDKTCCKS